MTLTVMPGSETWLRVSYENGRWFQVPAETSALVIVQGVNERWTGNKRTAQAPTWVRIRADHLAELDREKRYSSRTLRLARRT